MSEEVIVLETSNEAASIQTVSGWVSRRGNFWGNDERMARFDGATHRTCECGEVFPLRSYCEKCHAKRQAEMWSTMPMDDWNGAALLYSQANDVYFQDIDGLRDYCDDNECALASLRLIICKPNMPREIDLDEIYSDSMPDDGGDLPEDIEEAMRALNKVIRECRTPLSWSPGPFRPTPESFNLE